MELGINIYTLLYIKWVSQVLLVVRNLSANAGHIRDLGSSPGSGRSPGGGHGNLLQYSFLENSMDKGAWHATVHGVTKSERTEQLTLSLHINIYVHIHKRLFFRVCFIIGYYKILNGAPCGIH